ncbi:MAG: 50S ribosomal protein L10 [Legionellales bacterium]|nr:50S ribosomal protein L10 [Legionellales bacterium]
MALTLAEKQAVVAEVSEVASQAISAVVADYRGMTVSQMTQLRSDARKAGIYVRVVKNTLCRRAVENTMFECLNEALTGPVFLAFSQQAPSSAARLLKDFAKNNSNVKVKGIALNGQLLDASQLDFVASLPTKDEAIAKLLYVLKAPITQLARTMAEPHAQLVRLIAAIGDQKRAG